MASGVYGNAVCGLRTIWYCMVDTRYDKDTIEELTLFQIVTIIIVTFKDTI
jgi:hypothetical protein